MKKRASVSIFLAMISFFIITLMFAMIESARTSASRYYLQVSTNSAVDSLFSNFNKTLWNKYKVFAMEYISDEELELEIKKYLDEYIKHQDMYGIKEAKVDILESKKLKDENGYWLEEEILDYMKYAVVDIDIDKGKDIEENVKNASSIQNITNNYSKGTKASLKLEKKAKKCMDIINKYQDKYKKLSMASNSKNKSSIADSASDMLKLIDNIIKSKKEYLKVSEKLIDELENIKEKTKKDWENILPDTQMELNNEDSSYQNYIVELRQRNQELISYMDSIVDKQSNLHKIREHIDNIIDYIDMTDEDNSYEDEISSEYDEISLIVDHIYIEHKGIKTGVKDEQKENEIHNIFDFLQGDILKLVLPKNIELSKDFIDKNKTYKVEDKRNLPKRNLLSNMLIDEYSLRYFDNILDNSSSEFKYELEYIVSGKETDRKNLVDTLEKILALRQGMNYLHILKDSKKMEAVNTLASSIMGIVGLPALTFVLAFFIVGVWALAESVIDIKILLNGGDIPFIKAETDWKLSLENLFHISDILDSYDKTAQSNKDDKKLFDYKNYIRCILVLEKRDIKNYRMLDIMEKNMFQNDNPIKVGDMVYGSKVEVSAISKRFFKTFMIENALSDTFSIKTIGVKMY